MENNAHFSLESISYIHKSKKNYFIRKKYPIWSKMSFLAYPLQSLKLVCILRNHQVMKTLLLIQDVGSNPLVALDNFPSQNIYSSFIRQHTNEFHQSFSCIEPC